MPVRSRSFQDCLARIAKAGKLSPQRATDILQEVARRAEEMRRTGRPDPVVTAAGQLAGRLKAEAKRTYLDAVRNAKKPAEILQEVANNGGLPNAANTLYGLIHGHWKGTLDSAQALWKGRTKQWTAVLDNKLDLKGVGEAWRTGLIDLDATKELWALTEQTKPREPGQPAPSLPGVSRNNAARTIAGEIKPIYDLMMNRMNAAGANIFNALDWAGHTLHDAYKIRRAAGAGATPDQAFGQWWHVTKPRLAESTFRDLKVRENETEEMARDRFGRSVFDALITGVHMRADGALGLPTDAEGYIPPAWQGTKNIGKKVSEARVLRFRDATAWHEYMSAFGEGRNMAERVMRSIEHGARQVALMERFGTNPRGNFNMVLRRIQEIYRSDLDGVQKFQGKIHGLENRFDWLDGSASIPANAGMARFGSGLRSGIVGSTLGGVGLTHFMSIWPTVPAELRRHGINRLESLGGIVNALLKGMPEAEKREHLSDMGAYHDSSTRDMMGRFDADDYPVPGALSTIAHMVLKYSGINYVFDNTQAGVRGMLSHNLARQAGKTFDDLRPELQGMLQKYRIGSAEWDLLRGVGNLDVVNGRAYLKPSDALRVDRSAVEDLLRQRGVIAPEAFGPEVTGPVVDRFIQDLQDSLVTYYSDSAARSVVTPGVRERAMLMGNTTPGSFQGEMWRFLMQFKLWPMAAFDQTLRGEFFMSAGGGKKMFNIGVLLGLSMISGYGRMLVNDVALGRPPRDPKDPATLLAAMVQGGGTGILGDFLFGQTSRMSAGLLATVGGPLVGDIDSLVQIWNRFRTDAWDTSRPTHPRGQFSDLWSDLAHLAVRHVPFANLIYVKGALDYLLWYHLYEAASPGWWERTNRRLQREQGRAMSGYVPGGGVPSWPPPFNQFTVH
jgi:hypothetical protein